MKDKNLLSICEGAICIAIGMLLSYIKIMKLPQGGSITLTMLPLFVYCYKWGIKKGLIVTFAFGIFQQLLDGFSAVSFWSMLLDNVLAYGVLGICGLFDKNISSLCVGAAVATFCRFIIHFISGVTIYRSYAPSKDLLGVIIYSAGYNGIYLLCSLILCIIIILVLQKMIDKNYRNKK